MATSVGEVRAKSISISGMGILRSQHRGGPNVCVRYLVQTLEFATREEADIYQYY